MINNMTNETACKPKLGAGIISLSIIQIIFISFSIIGYISFLIPSTKDLLGNDFYDKLNLNEVTIKIYIAISIITIISLLLILFKRNIGIYTYITISLISIIFTNIMNGFNIIAILRGMIIPVLMAWLLYKKNYINFNKKEL